MRTIINVSDLDGNEQTYQIAGLGSRAYAAMLDCVIKILLIITWCHVASMVWQVDPLMLTVQFFQDPAETPFPWPVLGPVFMIWFGYTVICETLFRGLTIGRLIVGIRCITLRGRSPAFYAILLRNLFRLIDVLPGTYLVGMIFLFFSSYQLRLGDMIAGTIMIHYGDVSKKTHQPAIRTLVLDPEQHQYLGEMLERWDNMKMERRVQLARDFLRTIGKEAPEGLIDETIDKALHAQLMAIRKH